MPYDLQIEVHDWHLKNYPTDDLRSALLGVGEELGELMRVELKQTGGIRGTFEYWQEEKRKEIGDVLIGLLNACAYANIDFQTSGRELELQFAGDGKDVLLEIAIHFGFLITHLTRSMDGKSELYVRTIKDRSKFNLDCIFEALTYYCGLNNFSLEDVFLSRWNIIRQRDFIINPETGGREKEISNSFLPQDGPYECCSYCHRMRTGSENISPKCQNQYID